MRFFVVSVLFFFSVLSLCISGCGGYVDEHIGLTPVSFHSARPPGGELAANGSILVTFDGTPFDVAVSEGTVTVDGKTATITGPFTPGPLVLTITWVDGTEELNYIVTAPD